MISAILRKAIEDTLVETDVFSSKYIQDIITKIDQKFSKAKGESPKEAPKATEAPMTESAGSRLGRVSNILSGERVTSLAVPCFEAPIQKTKSSSRAASILG